MTGMSTSAFAKSRIVWMICIACLLGISMPMAAGAAEVVDRVVAVVNDDIIRLRELNQALEPVEKQIRSEDMSAEETQKQLFEARERVLDELIQEVLADQQIADTGIQVDESDVDAAIEQIKSRNYYTDEDLRQALQMQGMSMEQYRGEIKNQMLRSQLVNRKVKSKIVITEEDIRRYYEAHPEKYGGTVEYKLRNIVMQYPEYDDQEAKAEVKEEMNSVRDALEQGASFEKMAREYSEAGNASDGGQLGKFALDDLSRNLKPVIRDLEAGEFSDIVETEQGFQIFYVQDIVKTDPEPLEKVSDKIENTLYEQQVNEKYDAWIQSLREDAHIRIIR
ncbi:MAG: SurA N-terminal domain-containing protein [Desulfobacterales bacterium]